ncbi:MAG: tetratricopeptide repeat protein [Opitutaceae bacterium]|nr:tetratricopeptide repeat protein [Opitutaceae bacterium]
MTLLLFIGTLLLFGRSVGFGFVNYDDSGHIFNNPHVQAGLTGESLRWAFTGEGVIWNPLTRLSHLVDGQLYGLRPWGHHLTSVLWHAANAALAFLLLRRLTASFWASALCAALFAWHPLRVESVTWVSERKDVLSGFFFLLTLWTYVGYAESRRTSRPGATEVWRRYALTLLCFLGGLLSKPMLVTLPGVLLLLDFWPLRRAPLPTPLGGASSMPAIPGNPASQPVPVTWPALLMEKLPFAALAALFSLVAMHTQQAGGAFVLQLSLLDRLANAPVAVARYLGKFFWPFDLVVAYPHPGTWPLAIVAGAILLLTAVTAFALHQGRPRPWLLVGWLWFLGMLVPVIGIVQVGFQSIADRYTYLPTLGLSYALAWTLRALATSTAAKAVLAGVVLAGLGIRSIDQQGHWRSSVALYQHAIDCVPNNTEAEVFLGFTLEDGGHDAEATPHVQRALELAPKNPIALATRARLATKQGRFADAEADYRASLAAKPHEADTQYALALLLLSQQRVDEALAAFRAALDLQPDRLEVLMTLAETEAATGLGDDAVRRFEAALVQHPTTAALHTRYALLLADLGRTDDALAHAGRAVELAPTAPIARTNYANLLRLAGQTATACEHYRLAAAAAPADAAIHYGLGLALRQNQELDAALAAFEAAARLQPTFAAAQTEAGLLLLARQQAAPAAARFRQALAADSSAIPALLGLARAAVQLGTYDEAAASLQQAIALQPENPEPYTTWAEILVRQKRFTEAIPPYEKAASLQPADPEAHAALGYALLFAGRPLDARREWEEALRLNPDFPMLRERLQKLP